MVTPHDGEGSTIGPVHLEVNDQPAGRRPAPGHLAVVQAFVNTNDIEGGNEHLRDPVALDAWLRTAGLHGGTRSSVSDLRRGLELREGLRALGAINAGEQANPLELERLNMAVRRLPLAAALGPHGWHLEPHAEGVTGALAWIVAVVIEAMSDGTWSRMKACRRDRCRWMFYDYSKNRSGHWCAMEICGNKEKAAAYRSRRQGSRPARRSS